MRFLPIYMFVMALICLMAGFPVAFTLAGVALLFVMFGLMVGVFDVGYLGFLFGRIFGILNNEALVAIPLFILMGTLLERSNIADRLLRSFSWLLRGLPNGLAIAVVCVGALLAASTGIVGATVITLGLLALPTFLEKGYDKPLACGVLCATGTLGQIIPPSIALILLADVLSTAYQEAQANMGVFTPDTLSVRDLFIGALVPGFVLVVLYVVYLLLVGISKNANETLVNRGKAGQDEFSWQDIVSSLLAPLSLIICVLGSILLGYATPTEASALGAMGALLLAWYVNSLDFTALSNALSDTLKHTSMVFAILIGASVFALVFRVYEGDELVLGFLNTLPEGKWMALAIVMLSIFLLGFILDFIEITFLVIPIVAPALLMMGMDPIWLGVLIAVNLQTSFLTPPMGFSLFYLKGIVPAEVSTLDIYKGVIPFIALQIILLLSLLFFPSLATWLPNLLR